MNRDSYINAQRARGEAFDLFRLSRSKEIVDICPNTLRAYNRQGLKFYRSGKCVFVSKLELEMFIRESADKTGKEGN